MGRSEGLLTFRRSFYIDIVECHNNYVTL